MKERLKTIRNEKGLSQAEFGEKIGLARSTVAKYETSNMRPPKAKIKLICREFNVNESWLLTGEGEMYIEMNSDLLLAEWFGSLLKENPESFKKQFITMLSKLNKEEWNALQKISSAFSLLPPQVNARPEKL